MPEQIKSSDQFTWTYALWLLPFLGADWVYWLAPQWDWGTIDLIVFLVTLIAIAGSLCFNLVLRRWRRALSLVTAPLLLLICLHLLAAAGIAPDSVRFALTRQAYLAEIKRSDVGHPFRTFVWDDTFRHKTYSTLVYDESDEIALPKGEQSAAWQQRLQTFCLEKKKECVTLDPGPDNFISVSKIGEHFYILDDSLPAAFP
ncbi:hypothetical protein PYR71_00110 [Rhizobium sp. MC63]|uniref:Uncharacterized protein n=1 Tax=Rhizobium mulingense TaxID=3031128 RepID=A0ACC6MWL5_9HYPH|nr:MULTISPECIES: hypothetical protein [unclassified Rhizobium]MDF0694935.1 hypothetical protein [Rhizobium sp. MC63]MEA3517700.1 hypothetical protein [Rhizobium sp. MJ31]